MSTEPSLTNDSPPEELAPLPKLQLGLVMNGGGVKGLAFVGALYELTERCAHVEFTAFGGASAGAIGATALAMGHDVETLGHILHELPFSCLLRSTWEPEWDVPPRELKAIPEPAWRSLVRATVLPAWLLLRATFRGSLYSSAPVGRLIRYLNQWRPTGGAALRNQHPGDNIGSLAHSVMIIASSSSGKTEVFEDHEGLELAVRASMAIPVFFEPIERRPYMLYDGGMQANFPFSQFEARHPNDDLIGLYLHGDTALEQRDHTKSLWGTASNSIRIFMGQDEVSVLRDNPSRIVPIDTTPIGTVDFNLSDEDKALLLESGRFAVASFLYSQKHALAASRRASVSVSAPPAVVATVGADAPLIARLLAHASIPSDEEITALRQSVAEHREAARKRWKWPHRWRRLVLAVSLLFALALLLAAGSSLISWWVNRPRGIEQVLIDAQNEMRNRYPELLFQDHENPSASARRGRSERLRWAKTLLGKLERDVVGPWTRDPDTLNAAQVVRLRQVVGYLSFMAAMSSTDGERRTYLVRARTAFESARGDIDRAEADTSDTLSPLIQDDIRNQRMSVQEGLAEVLAQLYVHDERRDLSLVCQARELLTGSDPHNLSTGCDQYFERIRAELSELSCGRLAPITIAPCSRSGASE